MPNKILSIISILGSIALLSSCLTETSSTTASTTPSPAGASTSYTIGVVVSGLTGTLVLQNNGRDNLTSIANTTGIFATPLSTGTTYSITVPTQPSGETCTVVNGSGTVRTSNVTNVTVSCDISRELTTYF